MARIKYQEAAGMPVKRGRPSIRPAPLEADLIKLYVNEMRSVRDVALVLGCTKDAVHRGIKKYGIKSRSNASRSKLRTIPYKDMKTEVQEKGIRRTARELGVNEGTLRHHLKVRNGT